MTGTPSIDITKVNAKLTQLRKEAPALAAKAEQTAAEAILSEAQVDAPVLSGFLKDSALAIRSGRKVFFGFTARYAAAVHERHPTKPGFLRNAIRTQGLRIINAVVSKEFRRSIGGGR